MRLLDLPAVSLFLIYLRPGIPSCVYPAMHMHAYIRIRQQSTYRIQIAGTRDSGPAVNAGSFM